MLISAHQHTYLFERLEDPPPIQWLLREDEQPKHTLPSNLVVSLVKRLNSQETS